MARKLYYFDLKGLGEGIRYILHYGELEFEDIRISHDDWPKHKESLAPPFGKLPIYKEGDVTIHQSSSIAKYIGRQVGLVPTDVLQDTNADIVIQTLFDFFGNIRDFFRESDETKKEEVKKKIIDEHIPFYLSRFDKQLSENNGYFVKQLTWADIVFVAVIETINDFLKIEIQSNYKNIKALFEKVHNLKGINIYIRKRNIAAIQI